MQQIWQFLTGFLPPIAAAAFVILIAVVVVLIVLRIVKIVLDALPFL